jgi:hypothetical protein
VAIDYSTPAGQVRMLINDTTSSPVFSDAEIVAFLALEGDVVKRAAALALLTIAGDEALTSKVIRTQDLNTDGAKLAAELRAQAKDLRAQADAADVASDEGYFELVPFQTGQCGPELTERPHFWL